VATNEDIGDPTRVYTDCWEAYTQLGELNYEHHVINHQHGFGEGIETTNHIESFWSEIRNLSDFNKCFNTSDIEAVADHVKVAIWRWRNKNS